MKTWTWWLWMAMVLGPGPIWAANHYVRAGAAGNGSDWANAYGALPATLVRGDTYYIAGGTYGSYHCSTAQSGTAVITIKKATEADHGTEAGWAAAYGTSQAAWSGTIYFDTGYWIFDGQIRDETDWFDGASYGFRIYGGDQQIALGTDGTAESNIQIRNTYVQNKSGLPSSGVRWYGIDLYTWGGTGTFTGIVVSRCMFFGGSVPVFCGSVDGMIIEYSAFDANESNTNNHGEAVSAYYTCHRYVIRYNRFRATRGTAVIAAGGTSSAIDGFRFYGNVIWNSEIGDGIFGFSETDRSNFTNTKIYNNTIVDKAGGYNTGIAIMSGNNNLVYNNLWVNTATNFWQGDGATYSHNAYSWSRAETNAQVNVPTSVFVNYTGDDFRLAAPTANGLALAAPYNNDLLGNTRGADGVWDRGAFEYSNTGIDNDEVRMSNAEWKKKTWYQNPLKMSDAARLTGVQLHDLQGRPVRPEQVRSAGIFLAGATAGGLQKITIIP